MATRRELLQDLLHFGASLTGLAAFVLLLQAVRVDNPTTAALGFLVIVLVTATLARLRVAVLTSVSAMLALNYYFLPPIGNFTIADAENWVALLAFLAAAVVVSHLSAAGQARAREAVDRRNELARLYDLSRDVLLTTEGWLHSGLSSAVHPSAALTSPAPGSWLHSGLSSAVHPSAALASPAPGSSNTLSALTRHIARRFELDRVAICLPGAPGWNVHQGGERDISVDEQHLNVALARAGATLEFDARSRTYGGHLEVADAAGVRTLLVPLRFGTRPIGLLAAPVDAFEPGTLDAVAGFAAIAVERAQLLVERHEAELLRQRADLASSLLASVSHDLRTPLTVITVAISNLQDPKLDAEERRAQARTAQVELERLTRLVRDILDMARIDAKAIELQHDWVTPSDIVDAATANLRPALEGRDVRIDADSTLLVRVEPRLTSAALSHLIENALQYSPKDCPIDVRSWVEADGLHLTVTDRGPGLDPGELEHLFERFYRGRQAKDRLFGTGMGLAITRGLLAAEGGRVWGENVEGGGARFSLMVPAAIQQMTSID